MEKSLSYKDVYLVPKYSELVSRSQADISVEFLGRKFKAPWVPANMESVVDILIAEWLSLNGYFYIYHRFGKGESDTLNFVERANRGGYPLISISVGVGEEAKKLIETIASRNLRVDFITIDVAHGHHVLVKEMIKFIKIVNFSVEFTETLSCGGKIISHKKETKYYTPKIIAGNVCTKDAVLDLEKWGADAVKVGIAGGHACSTKNMTGFHIPMFSCVKDIYAKNVVKYDFTDVYRVRPIFEPNISIPIIADGGIRENGDISKALVAGATMVMAGGLFAACVDAPGENTYPKGYWREWLSGDCITKNRVWVNGPLHKRYYGSASAKQKGSHTHVEGFEIEIPSNNLTYSEKYRELTESLQSAVSYAGGNNLEAFKKVEYIKV